MQLEPLTTINFYLFRFEVATYSFEPDRTLASLLEFSENSHIYIYIITIPSDPKEK